MFNLNQKNRVGALKYILLRHIYLKSFKHNLMKEIRTPLLKIQGLKQIKKVKKKKAKQTKKKTKL